MDQKTAKKELVILIILFVVGFIFNFYAPEKYRLDFSDMERLGFGKGLCAVGKILAPLLMGWIVSGIYATWKLIGLIWRYIIQKTNRIWITSGFLFFIGVIIKLFLSIQFSVLGFPIYVIYCLKKKE